MSSDVNKVSPRPKLPPWIRIKVAPGSGRDEINSLLNDLNLNTVCASAQCPNMCECFHRRTATFLIMGNECTRNCKFCAVTHSASPAPLDPDEPQHVAEAVRRMNLKYVVITCVTRDDLPDGGAGHFVNVINEIRKIDSAIGVEVLTSDFNGNIDSLRAVLEASPTVFNHNVEMVERLSSLVRSQATYRRSMSMLNQAARISNGLIPIKSGIMVGLGETDAEVIQTLKDLYQNGVTVLTIGQYLPPSKDHYPLDRYVTPEKFDQWGALAQEIGFKFVASGPLVRSSYNAAELVDYQG